MSLKGASGQAGSGSLVNVPYTLSQWAIPFISGPTGTMANNGAVTWGTALPTNYSTGAWVLLPAGAIAAGVPAAPALLWYVGATTTTGTFFNSTYTAGTPPMGTATAFSTTGPGAFTGVTAEAPAIVITIPANSIGPNGEIIWDYSGFANNTAGAKTFRVHYSAFGGTTIYSAAQTTSLSIGNLGFIQNRSVTNAQVTGNLQAVIVDTAGVNYLTVDTTAASTLVWTLGKAVATDVQVIERGRVMLNFGA